MAATRPPRSKPVRPQVLPLCATNRYCVHILDAGGWGANPAQMSGAGHIAALCAYSLHQFTSAQVVIRMRETEATFGGSGVVLIPAGKSWDLHSREMCEGSWIHFLVRHEPDWPPTAFGRNYKLEAPDRRGFLQPEPLAVWGLDLPCRPEDADLLRFSEEAKAIVALWRTRQAAGRARANLRLGVLLAQWVESEWVRARGLDLDDDGQRLDAVIRHAHCGMNVKGLASLFGMSRPAFSVWFTRQTGGSPGQFLRCLRLRQAAVVLMTSEMPIKEIALAVGYDDAASLNRAIRKTFGASPSEFRNARFPGRSDILYRLLQFNQVISRFRL